MWILILTTTALVHGSIKAFTALQRCTNLLRRPAQTSMPGVMLSFSVLRRRRTFLPLSTWSRP